MAQKLPTIPDDKIRFYKDLLFREVSNLFEWDGMPEEIPLDYLENSLLKHGRVMFFYERETFGYMCLEAGTRGLNVYNKPVEAYATAPNTTGRKVRYNRKIAYIYNDLVDDSNGCVLIDNMYDGKPISEIVHFYAKRLAMVQQAYDTNALWQNIPALMNVPDSTTKTSIERMFGDIYEGKPWIIIDELLMAGEKPVQAFPVQIPFLLDKLHDAMNGIKSNFREAIGINTAGADKKERLIVDEVNSNKQALETCLQIMLSQREKACDEIRHLFPALNPTVTVRGEADAGTYSRREDLEEGSEEDGYDDD